jgi:hypothetical protein
VKHWESIVEKLNAGGWQVCWIESMHDGEMGWPATAIRERALHSSHLCE